MAFYRYFLPAGAFDFIILIIRLPFNPIRDYMLVEKCAPLISSREDAMFSQPCAIGCFYLLYFKKNPVRSEVNSN